jgi:hypothetical protein
MGDTAFSCDVDGVNFRNDVGSIENIPHWNIDYRQAPELERNVPLANDKRLSFRRSE